MPHRAREHQTKHKRIYLRRLFASSTALASRLRSLHDTAASSSSLAGPTRSKRASTFFPYLMLTPLAAHCSAMSCTCKRRSLVCFSSWSIVCPAPQRSSAMRCHVHQHAHCISSNAPSRVMTCCSAAFVYPGHSHRISEQVIMKSLLPCSCTSPSVATWEKRIFERLRWTLNVHLLAWQIHHHKATIKDQDLTAQTRAKTSQHEAASSCILF